MNSSTQNLLLLLAAAPMSMGCSISINTDDFGGDLDTTTTDGESTTTGEDEVGTSESTESTTTEGTTDTGETDAGQTEGTGGTDTGGTDTGGTDTGGTDTGGTDTDGEDVCVAYADLVTMCYDADAGMASFEACENTALEYYELYGADCLAVFEDFIACLSALPCDEFVGPDPVCLEEEAAVDMLCVGP